MLDSAFDNAQAIIVLLSPDDEVRLLPELWHSEEDNNEKEYRLQARPNVLFEAGMAFGRNPKRTLLIEVGQVKAFSDVAGRHVIRLSNSTDKRHDVSERLRTAGCDVSTVGKDWLHEGNFTIHRDKHISVSEEPSNDHSHVDSRMRKEDFSIDTYKDMWMVVQNVSGVIRRGRKVDHNRVMSTIKEKYSCSDINAFLTNCIRTNDSRLEQLLVEYSDNLSKYQSEKGRLQFPSMGDGQIDYKKISDELTDKIKKRIDQHLDK